MLVLNAGSRFEVHKIKTKNWYQIPSTFDRMNFLSNLKKTTVFLLMLALIFAAPACGVEETEQLRSTNDSLEHKVQVLEDQLVKVGMGTKVLNSNIDSISALENEIRMAMTMERNADEAVLAERIKKLASLVTLNRSIIEALKADLDENDLSSHMLLEMILKLDQKVKSKELEIARLNESLNLKENELNKLLGDYNALKLEYDKQGVGISEFKEKVKNLETALDSKSEQLIEKELALSTAYYSFGSKKELMKMGLLEKSGMSKSSLNADFNKETLNRIDVREFKELVIPSASAQVLSEHPSSSYTIENHDGTGTILRIHDHLKFWSYSKLLVIQTSK